MNAHKRKRMLRVERDLGSEKFEYRLSEGNTLHFDIEFHFPAFFLFQIKERDCSMCILYESASRKYSVITPGGIYDAELSGDK